MKQRINKAKAVLLVVIANFVFFILLTLPFKLWVAASEITQMRPAAALTPVLGMVFGWPAAIGCALGNFVCDKLSRYELLYAVLDSLLQAVYAMAAYFLRGRIDRNRSSAEFRLDSVAHVLQFSAVLAANAVLTVICSGILNTGFRIASLFSADNLYLLINSFDAGLLFGAPILILGNFLHARLENMKAGKPKEVIHFSMNERMIINTIVTGLCICTLVGLSVYLTDRYGSNSGIGILGGIYLFETLALNVYFALSIGFMRFTEEKISRPIEHLAQVAQEFYSEPATDDRRKQLVSFCGAYAQDSTEVGMLARSYIAMARDLDQYVQNLKKVTEEKERINADLSIASDIQAHMLPCIFPPFPDHREFELYAVMHPAREVGGDFYDFYMIDEDHLAVSVADVSGKGVPAALFMVIAKTLVKNYMQTGMQPADVFCRVNRMLCDGNDAGMFVTAWTGVLELSTGKLTYVNAGHNPPLLKKKDGAFAYLRGRTGFVLAGMENAKYTQSELTISPGDRLFLYTDGVTETANAQQQLYGEERLCSFLNDRGTCPLCEILPALQEELREFAGTAPQYDDITMLLLEFKGSADHD